MKHLFLITAISLVFQIESQSQAIELADIWEKRTFAEKGIHGFNFTSSGGHFTRLISNSIIEFDIVSGKEVNILFDSSIEAEGKLQGKIESYVISKDEKKILLATMLKPIYRYSRSGIYYIWDVTNKTLKEVYLGKSILHPSFTDAGDKLAFVHNNNLYYQDLLSDKIVQITADGEQNKIINGASDWVYEEEFEITQAFTWSPKGDQIAF